MYIKTCGMHVKRISSNPINIMPILNTGRSPLQQPYMQILNTADHYLYEYTLYIPVYTCIHPVYTGTHAIYTQTEMTDVTYINFMAGLAEIVMSLVLHHKYYITSVASLVLHHCMVTLAIAFIIITESHAYTSIPCFNYNTYCSLAQVQRHGPSLDPLTY